MKQEAQVPREVLLEYALADSRVHLATSRHELLVQTLRAKYEAEIRESLATVNAATAQLDATVRKLRSAAGLTEHDLISAVSDDGVVTFSRPDPTDP
jgi:hypothetical protein